MPPSKNSTAPAGVEVPVALVTVAVRVTGWPNVDGLGAEARAVAVRSAPAYSSAPAG
jgi:hypothetical protein